MAAWQDFVQISRVRRQCRTTCADGDRTIADIPNPTFRELNPRQLAGEIRGETYDFEIGIPKGFAVTASRKTPVTIAVDLTTLGERERKIVQDINRSVRID
jgi:hypothetical protein